MPAEPIVEQIAEDLKAALAKISRSGGYYTDATVERFKAGGNTANDAKIVIAQGNPQGPSDAESHGLTTWLQPFEIEATLIQSEAVAGTPETRINRMWADIVRALYADRTRGGLAVDTTCEPPTFFADGLVVECVVHYRHVEGDPTTQA